MATLSTQITEELYEALHVHVTDDVRFIMEKMIKNKTNSHLKVMFYV